MSQPYAITLCPRHATAAPQLQCAHPQRVATGERGETQHEAERGGKGGGAEDGERMGGEDGMGGGEGGREGCGDGVEGKDGE